MADRPAVMTQRTTRDKLAQFLPNHPMVKLFENLVGDVSDVLPDAVLADRVSIEATQRSATVLTWLSF